jgi:hypothetical protein
MLYVYGMHAHRAAHLAPPPQVFTAMRQDGTVKAKLKAAELVVVHQEPPLAGVASVNRWSGAAVAAGGLIGFLRAKSVPSLVAGSLVGGTLGSVRTPQHSHRPQPPLSRPLTLPPFISHRATLHLTRATRIPSPPLPSPGLQV